MAKNNQTVVLDVPSWANNAHKQALMRKAMLAQRKEQEKRENKEVLCKIAFFVVMLVAFAWANN